MYLILDCCFAGSAVDSFQGASDELITIQSDKLPTGVALLNASSRHAAAVVPEGSVYTMFSGCLVEVLKKGIPNGGPLLSLREVRNAVAEAVIAKYPDPVRPEVHSPRQRDGDPADIPLFPNPSYVERAPREGGETPGISVLNIAQVYNFPTSLSGKGECVGIITLGGDGYRKSDLQTYFAGLRLSMPRIDSMYIAGATGGTSDGLGLHLTIQIEICGAIAPAARLIVYSAPNTDQGFVGAVRAAAEDDANKPSVLLIAWGARESYWKRESVFALNDALKAAVAKGISVCCAAADNQADVVFPASSPYVFACGGSSLTIAGGMRVEEVAWSGSRGVSRFFPTPEWQQHGLVPYTAGGEVATGRAIPDISANADPKTGYRFFFGGKWSVGGGTTAAAALWAGLIALANEALGCRPAFTHEDLYRYFGPAGVFYDVTQGNKGAGRHPGYEARVGWDACTGWGSPDGRALVLAAKLVAQFRAMETSRSLSQEGGRPLGPVTVDVRPCVARRPRSSPQSSKPGRSCGGIAAHRAPTVGPRTCLPPSVL